MSGLPQQQPRLWRLYECIGERDTGKYQCKLIGGDGSTRPESGNESRIVYVPNVMPPKWDADMICLMLGKPCHVSTS